MIETIQAFLRSINERKHVLRLIENTELTIEFIMKDETFSLFLKKGEVFITDTVNNPAIHCSICGDREIVKALISGREKLRTLMMKGNLQCSGTFRTLLLLESLFYLGKTDLLAKIS